MAPVVLWFRRDLRLDDLPALLAAAGAGGDCVVPLFILDPSLLAPAGPNRRRFLAEALRALDEQVGGTLVLRGGRAPAVVPTVAREVGARRVVVSADFGPYGSKRDRAVAEALSADGRRLVARGSPYAVAPGTVLSRSGAPYQVFSAFRRAWDSVAFKRPSPMPVVRFAGAGSDALVADLDADVATPGNAGLPSWWEGLPLGGAARLPAAGSKAASDQLDAFVEGPLPDYGELRDRPGIAGTSRLSPYLRFGCIHPRTVLSRIGTGAGTARVRAELAWREFYADVLWHRPDSARRPLQAFGRHLRWDSGDRAEERFRDWATGRTGYPLVDAGMRQLLAEGWMHNRVRMVTASFLVKDLHLDWRLGSRWFMWHLVDGDLASNQHNWQWVAGTGTDAAPFHRVLNPDLQQRRFDPDGSYVRRYLDEQPATSRSGAKADADDFRRPIVDHAGERAEALGRLAEARLAAAHDPQMPPEAP